MKLKSHSFQCLALAPGWIRATVKVNTDGVFSVVIPRKIRALMNQDDNRDSVGGATLAEATRRFDALIKLISSSRITRKRIIACKFEATLAIEGLSGEYKNRLLNRDDIAFQTGAAIAFACNVLDMLMIESTTGETWYRYEDVYTDEEHPFPYSFRRAHGSCSYFSLDGSPDGGGGDLNTRVIPWTQEAEDFFADSCESFCKLALRLDETFSASPKKLAAAISSRLLPMTTEEKPRKGKKK